MSRVDVYQTHLDRVSRSFALCISRLEAPLRQWVGLTYLMCRILDTIEDASWGDKLSQQKAFDQFDRLIQSPAELSAVSWWVESFPKSIPEGERLLLKEAQVLLEDLHQAPPHIKVPIQELVQTMSAGMREFVNSKSKGTIRLKGLREVNQYCFFVAGIVGETLSKLLNAVDAKLKITRPLIVDAHHFGLFLQKVNLLKDQMGDEKEGRFLVPSREETFLSLKENAEGAMRYIEALPVEQKSYRVFCLWSLFLGLRTLPLLKMQNSELAPNKIPREETLETFKQIEDFSSESAMIRSAFEDLIAKVFTPGIDVKTEGMSDLDWTPKFYSGLLKPEDFRCLNMAN
ncbi:MAG: squalene/phytoene synthase family protein [Bdellovibrionales bacterium]|nr:squalene/phytoene synthase family protein [Bdellovibrionales bacterium]